MKRCGRGARARDSANKNEIFKCCSNAFQPGATPRGLLLLLAGFTVPVPKGHKIQITMFQYGEMGSDIVLQCYWMPFGAGTITPVKF